MAATMRKLYFDTAYGQLHCQVSRPDCSSTKQPHETTPVLLLHMSASSSKSCVPLMRRLSTLGFCCFAPDMPGFGESFDPQPDPPDIAWYANLYYSTFTGLPEFGEGCHIIGHHSGAVIGTDLAMRHGSFVQSLTLVGPAVMPLDERQTWAEETSIPFNKPVQGGSHLIKVWEYLVSMGIPRSDLDLLQRETLDHARAWNGRLQIYACVWRYDAGAALFRVPHGCKIIALCARDDVLWPYFRNVEMARPGCATEEIGGANFGPDLAVDDVLEAFLSLNERPERCQK